MKTLSIPKLEMQAAFLASCLRLEIEKILKIEIETSYMRTDSTTVSTVVEVCQQVACLCG